jgi:hypothetical protein
MRRSSSAQLGVLPLRMALNSASRRVKIEGSFITKLAAKLSDARRQVNGLGRADGQLWTCGRHKPARTPALRFMARDRV